MEASIEFYPRRLLLHKPLFPHNPPPPSSAAPPPSMMGDKSFDANVVMVLSVLLCALICSLGLNFCIKCALRCSGSITRQFARDSSAQVVSNTGINKKALKSFTIVSYSPELNLPGLDTECAICLSEFVGGDRVRLLPKCNHGFHVKCIDEWLNSHSSCPKCRQCLIETCQKIVGCSSTPPPPPPPPPVEEGVIVSIAPLEPEGLVSNYRES